jgi:hypothetical protein
MLTLAAGLPILTGLVIGGVVLTVILGFVVWITST